MFTIFTNYPIRTFFTDKAIRDFFKTFLYLPKICIHYFCIFFHGFIYHIQQMNHRHL